MNDTKLMTVKEVAEDLKVSQKTVLRKKDEIGFIKIGRSIRFEKERVLAYLRGQYLHNHLTH